LVSGGGWKFKIFFAAQRRLLKTYDAIGGGGSKISDFFRLSAAAAEIFLTFFQKTFYFREIFEGKNENR
jgi:hypothetical protein